MAVRTGPRSVHVRLAVGKLQDLPMLVAEIIDDMRVSQTRSPGLFALDLDSIVHVAANTEDDCQDWGRD